MIRFAILSLIPLMTFAQVEKRESFQTYRVQKKTNEPVAVVVTKTFQTSDTCNHFNLTGMLKAVEQENLGMVEQSFVADIQVATTMISCPPSREKRTISLKSQQFYIEPIFGKLDAKVLVPEGMELKLVK